MIVFILGAILGFMVFFPTTIAPIIFKIFNEEQSGKFLRVFFPRYYLFGLILSLIGLILSLNDQNLINISAFIILIVTFIFSRQVLTPEINKAKDKIKIDGKQFKQRFERLHSISVIINFFQIIMCVLLLLNILIIRLEF